MGMTHSRSPATPLFYLNSIRGWLGLSIEVQKSTELPVHTDAFLWNLVWTSKDKQNNAIFINFHDQFDQNFKGFLPLFATIWDI